MLATARKTSKKELNKLLPEDSPAHGWYRFVLSYPPHLVRDYLTRFGVTAQQTVLDPFSGTGTTLVECKKLGIPSLGIEANPMAHFASTTKIDWRPEPHAFTRHVEATAEMAALQLSRDGIRDEELPLYADAATEVNSRVKLRTLGPELEKLLLTSSISPLPLHKTLVLLEHIDAMPVRVRPHARLALARTTVFETSNLHFGPEVGVGTIKKDAPVVRCWHRQAERVARDLEFLQGAAAVPSKAILSDSRQTAALLEPESIDAVITSPPYPNEKDYTRTTRLESVLLGFVRSKADLQELKKTLVRSNTRGVYKGDTDDELVAKNPEIQRIAAAIELRRIELGKTSGFERLYPRVAKLYFGGMQRHLSELRAALRPGARLAYVVGDQASYLRVMIRTGKILADIAESLGYQVEAIDLFRTRLATATKEQLREEVVLLRWPGSRRVPISAFKRRREPQ